MSMIDYAAILDRRFRDSLWTLSGDDYDGLQWLSETPKPTRSELDDLWAGVKKEMKEEAVAQMKARETAFAKLSALGLTDLEIKALLG